MYKPYYVLVLCLLCVVISRAQKLSTSGVINIDEDESDVEGSGTTPEPEVPDGDLEVNSGDGVKGSTTDDEDATTVEEGSGLRAKVTKSVKFVTTPEPEPETTKGMPPSTTKRVQPATTELPATTKGMPPTTATTMVKLAPSTQKVLSTTSDDDDLVGVNSGDGSATTAEPTPSTIRVTSKTKCQRMRETVMQRFLVGAFAPRCTVTGEFNSRQCHGSTGHCWCVDNEGRELDGTRRRGRVDCDQKHLNVVEPPRMEPEIIKIHTSKPDVPTTTIENNDIEIVESPSTPSNVVPGAETKTTGKLNIGSAATGDQELMVGRKKQNREGASPLISAPGTLAAIIGGAVVGLLCAILLVMFIVYRMRKKDEGSYALDEPKSPALNAYTKNTNREFYA